MQVEFKQNHNIIKSNSHMAYNLYHKYKKQYSEDSGTTWYDVYPSVTVASGSPVSTGYTTLSDCENQFKDYLVFEALEDDFSIDFIIPSGQTGYWAEYSIDNRITWHNTPTGSTYGGATIIRPPSINAGEKIYWRGRVGGNVFWENKSHYAFSQDYKANPKRFNISGNSLSMIFGYYFDEHELTEEANFPSGFFSFTNVVDASALKLPRLGGSGSFECMFQSCSALTTPPDLTNSTVVGCNVNIIYYHNYINGQQVDTDVIYDIRFEGGNMNGMFANCISLTRTPNFASASTSCFHMNDMFSGCTSLITSDDLPIPSNDYAHFCGNMFYGCTSLVTPPSILPGNKMFEMQYWRMFFGCASLTTAPELPSTTVTKSCYLGMFHGCTSLTTAPELPATQLAEGCYDTMFYGCTSLVNIPSILPGTTLYAHCYYSMFEGCTSITTAPELPATELVYDGNWGCYDRMFTNCSSLNYIKALFLTKPGDNTTEDWLWGVANTGTFIKHGSDIGWNTNNTGCGISTYPCNWTVQDVV